MDSISLANRMDSVQESATLALNARAKQLAQEGHTIYNLTAGELATDTPEYIRTAVAEKLDRNKYTPVAGLPELREAVAAHARNFYDLDWIKPGNVIATAGAKPALFGALLALLNPGDEVIVPVPGWTTSYTPLVELAGGRVIEVPLSDDFDLDVEVIKGKLSPKTRAIIINSPNNPTGAIFSAPALRDLAAALNDTPVWVIADDIYSKLVYDDDFRPVPTCGFENLIIINGFSKSQALTGWRIGYAIAPEPVTQAMTKLLSHITGNAPLPSQYAALEALKRDDQPPVSTLKALQTQRQTVVDGLAEAGIKSNVPGGAFYVLLDVHELAPNSAEWCESLLVEAGVALVPGEAFSAPGFARLTFVTDEKTLQAALAAIKKFVGGKA
ncbi:MAG TPA: pyridoxal phosphate-dependent aminotransferase [Verrucomicrobiae bacterium]|nr:pyridoxal phosphate-dependent aminotransferase [Verrucomicrobiae bacterium]